MSDISCSFALSMSLLILSGACVLDDEHDAERSVFAVAEQMEAEGLDPGPLDDGESRGTCTCGTGMDTDCEYLYYPATEVCYPYSGSQEYIAANRGQVGNASSTTDATVECAIGTLHYYDSELDPLPGQLHSISVYSRKPTGGLEHIYIDMYGGEMGDDDWDWQDDCNYTTAGQTDPRQTLCYTEPLDDSQVVVAFRIDLPNIYLGGDYYVRGFRLCYDHDGW